MKNKLFLLLLTLIVSTTSSWAQKVTLNRVEGRGYNSTSNHTTTSFSNLQTSGSVWSQSTTPNNFVLPTGNWTDALKRQTYSGGSAAEFVDWVTYKFETPSYSRIVYKPGYWVELYHYRQATPMRFAYLDYGDDANNYWKNRNADPNGQDHIYTATGADGNTQTGEQSAFKAGTSGYTHSGTRYQPEYELDNRTGESTMINYKYGVFVTSKGVGTSESKRYTTRMTTGYSMTAYYYKYVTFDANGGSGSMSGITVENNNTLPKNTLTNNGKKFICWNTKADGSGTSYYDEGAITATASDKGPVTLYAIWDLPYNIPETIGYFSNDKTFDIPIYVTQAGDYVLRFRTALGGYTYKTFGWGPGYLFKAKLGINSNGTSLICDGQETDVITTYPTNGDWGAYNNIHTVILKNLPAGESKLSISWADGTTLDQNASNFDFFSIEELVQHSIQFNANGGTGSMSAANYYIEGTELPQNTFAKANYTFVGWALTPEGDIVATDKGILNSEFVADKTSLTLYAIWKETNSLYLTNGITGPSDIINHDVTWNSTENAAFFNGSVDDSDHYLNIQGKPLKDANTQTGFTIEFDVYLFNDSRSWGRIFDIGKDQYNYFFLNGSNVEYYPDSPAGLMQMAYSYSTDNQKHETVDNYLMHKMQKIGSNQIISQWHHYKFVCAPGGYTTVSIDNIPVACKSADELLVNTLSQMAEFGNYYIGISSVSPGTDHSPHMYMRNLYFSPEAEGALWDGTKTIYKLSYESNEGSIVASTTTDKLPETLPVPTKVGKIFKGWYTNPDLTQAAVAGTNLEAPTTLYAKWEDDHTTDTEGGVSYEENATVTPDDVEDMLKEPGETPVVDLSMATVSTTDAPTIVNKIRGSEKGKNAFIILPAGTYTNPDAVNVIVGNNCENLHLIDQTPMESSVQNRRFTAKSATYVRAQGNEWGTVCLPFALQSDANIQYYTLGEVNDSKMYFTPIAQVAKNTPVVFRRLHGNEINVADTNAEIYVVGTETENTDATNWELKGTYKPITISHTNPNIFYIAQNKFWQATQATNDVKVPAYRAYFETTTAAPARSFTLVIGEGDKTTEIGTINADGTIETAPVYNIAGQRLSTTTKGINIINGKKIIK